MVIDLSIERLKRQQAHNDTGLLGNIEKAQIDDQRMEHILEGSSTALAKSHALLKKVLELSDLVNQLPKPSSGRVVKFKK